MLPDVYHTEASVKGGGFVIATDCISSGLERFSVSSLFSCCQMQCQKEDPESGSYLPASISRLTIASTYEKGFSQVIVDELSSR